MNNNEKGIILNRFWCLFFLILVLPCFCPAQQVDTIKVKVHHHEMVLYGSGEGKPVIILEAGGSGTHRNWQKVQPAISEFARIISYDRAGQLEGLKQCRHY